MSIGHSHSLSHFSYEYVEQICGSSLSFQWPLSPQNNLWIHIAAFQKNDHFSIPIHKLYCKLGVTQKEDGQHWGRGGGGGDIPSVEYEMRSYF